MKWIYTRQDDGIPGLPKEITDEEAEERGLTGLLKDAIAAGAYQAEGADAPVRTNRKKKSEVNDE